MLALARQLPEVYEHTHAVHAGSFVRTPGGRIDAEHIVVATHFPFPDRSLAFARAHPQRSYAIACSIAGEPPDGDVHQRRLAHALDPRHPATAPPSC